MTASITTLRLQNYGCIKDLKLEGLGGLNAFIGPNDSGKSTILRAVRTLCQAMFHRWSLVDGVPAPFAHGLVDESRLDSMWTTFSYELRGLRQHVVADHLRTNGDDYGVEGWNIVEGARRPAGAQSALHPEFTGLPAWMVRLDADGLRRPAALIPDRQLVSFFNERGGGLASVYDAIRNRGDESFAHITESVRKLFPTVRYIGLRNASASTKELQIELEKGEKVPAEAMSEGLLLYLAFAALPHLETPPVILVEEPENGLHPARIKDVVAVLREVSKTSQVFLATHSPLVVNELRPEEVFVTTRSVDRGTMVTRLDQTPNFEKRSSVYENGELWIAYADGNQESALLEAGQ